MIHQDDPIVDDQPKENQNAQESHCVERRSRCIKDSRHSNDGKGNCKKNRQRMDKALEKRRHNDVHENHGQNDAEEALLLTLLKAGPLPAETEGISSRKLKFALQPILDHLVQKHSAATLRIGWDLQHHFLGPPEGELALAEAAVYLASAPKSNRMYMAWKAALRSARETPSAPVPLHIRNAPTDLMKELGYGKGYRYDPDEPEGIAPQEYLPDEVVGQNFYQPGSAGFEESIKDRLDRWKARKEEARRRDSDI